MAVWKDTKRNYWVVKFVHKGHQFKKVGFVTKKDAAFWEAEKRRKIETIRSLPAVQITLKTLVRRYLKACEPRMRPNTIRQKEFVLKGLLKHLAYDPKAPELTPGEISAFLEKAAKKKGTKAANRYLRDIKALYNWAIRQEIIDCKNPCNKIDKFPEEPFEPYVPSAEDLARVRAVADQDERDLIDTLYHLAARIGEIERLTWKDISFQKRWVRLWTMKRRGGALMADLQPMSNTLYDVLKKRKRRIPRDTDYIFSIDQNTRRSMMKRLCNKAGVKPFGFHSIRHHVLSSLNETGLVSMKQVQRLARHMRQSTTETYLHLISKDLRDAMSVLDDLSSATKI